MIVGQENCFFVSNRENGGGIRFFFEKSLMSTPLSLNESGDVAQHYAPVERERALARLASLRERFVAEFGVAPRFVARSPGRVNLLGEHIDYNG